jgi:hypothetical protein
MDALADSHKVWGSFKRMVFDELLTTSKYATICGRLQSRRPCDAVAEEVVRKPLVYRRYRGLSTVPPDAQNTSTVLCKA